MRCAVVIPCWNEEANLPATMAACRRAIPGCTVVAAAAPSRDDTLLLAGREADRWVVSEKRQRAAQMNLGAAEALRAGADLLLFLHADTLLSPGAGEALERTLNNSRIVGGAFARRFDRPSPFLLCTCWLAEFRGRAVGWFLGDQAIFVRPGIFQALQGFRPMDRFEDLDFSRRMKKLGRVRTLRPPVLSSARRFDRDGPWRRTWRDFSLTLRFLCGDSSVTKVTSEGN